MVTGHAIRTAPGGWLSVPTPGPGIGRQTAQRLARTELAKPQYHQHSLWQLILNYLSRLLDQVTVARLPGGWWAPVVLVVIVLALAAGILVWTRSFRWTRRKAPALPLRAGARTAREHLREAQRLAGAGDYAEASLECVRAIAAELQERQVLLPRPGRTADEFAAEAGQALPAEAAALRDAAAVFDAICYGKRAGSLAGYQRLAGLAGRIGVGTGRGRAHAGAHDQNLVLPGAR